MAKRKRTVQKKTPLRQKALKPVNVPIKPSPEVLTVPVEELTTAVKVLKPSTHLTIGEVIETRNELTKAIYDIVREVSNKKIIIISDPDNSKDILIGLELMGQTSTK